MANPEHVEILLQGVKAWNKWRHEHPGVEPDLTGIDLRDRLFRESELYEEMERHPIPCNYRWFAPNLSGINFKNTNLPWAHLEGAKLWEANLEGADIGKAHLEGATLLLAKIGCADLSGAHLESSELSTAYLQKATLTKAYLNGAFLLGTHLEEAKLEYADIEGAKLDRAYLTGAKMTGVNLKRANLSEANLNNAILSSAQLDAAYAIAANFNGANLTGAHLTNAVFEGALFNGAILRHANCSCANMFGVSLQEAILLDAWMEGADLTVTNLNGADLRRANLEKVCVFGVTYDRWGKYQGIRLDGCHGSQRFIRHAKDQDYIEELRGWDGDMRPWKWSRRFWYPYLLWLLSCDCGRHMWPWVLWSVVLSGLFGVAYANYPLPSWVPDWLQGVLIAIAPGIKLPADYHSALTPYYFSIVTFTTLGFGDITPTNLSGQIWVIIEVILGYVMLGGLISIFANKLARRSG